MQDFSISDALKQAFLQLPQLNGGLEIIAQARKLLVSVAPEVNKALDDLETIARKLKNTFPHLPVSFDLSELRGYHYHTGVVFAAFIPSMGREIARGGRYDNIGAIFGRQRPATGFSADLKLLSTLSKNQNGLPEAGLILAPADDDLDLHEAIRDLRSKGQIVIQRLPGQDEDPKPSGCTATLTKQHQNWVIQPLQIKPE